MPNHDKKAKAKGKQRLEVCMWDEELQWWQKKPMPMHVVPNLIEKGNAVYPVNGACPIDPPIDDEVVVETE